jgi:hypothetical protein
MVYNNIVTLFVAEDKKSRYRDHKETSEIFIKVFLMVLLFCEMCQILIIDRNWFKFNYGLINKEFP